MDRALDTVQLITTNGALMLWGAGYFSSSSRYNDRVMVETTSETLTASMVDGPVATDNLANMRIGSLRSARAAPATLC
eukprot:scaffold25703_cov35-Tisochrysis_lutea.AAC.4